MGLLGFEPRTKGFGLVYFSVLAGLCLHRGSRFRWVPSSLYTFPLGLGSALPSSFSTTLGFADFDTIPRGVSHHVAQLSP